MSCYDYPPQDRAYSGRHRLCAARRADISHVNATQCGSLPTAGDLLSGRKDREESGDGAAGGDVSSPNINSGGRFRGKEPTFVSAELHREGGAIDAQLDVRALLHRQVVINSLVLEQPTINLVSDP